ncbi:MAG: FAD-dependent oxidoreductase [Sedimentisphaerales bacterium]|nr:FAD-dependent oxidoreductase [Sedimentisphaerales bacterium]
MAEFDPQFLQYAALIAHQLKSPVTAAMSLIQTVLGEFAGPLNPRQKELLEKALQRCGQSVQTSQRLLAIANALKNPQRFSGTSDLADILRRVQMQFADQAVGRDITLELDVAEASMPAIGLDAALTEAFEALVHNALKYTPDHGRIQLTLRPGATVDTLRINIADSGVGIAVADRERVFEPFFRTSTARSSDRPGTGLGLAFVKAVVEACGGSIHVSRSEMGGALFEVTLRSASSTQSISLGDKPMPSGWKVLIIGGVAAGPKVAAKIMRLRPDAQVTIVDKGKLLSYAGCGLPFYISGVVKNQAQLMSSAVGDLRDSVFFQKVKNVRVLNQTEALRIDRAKRRVQVRDMNTGRDSWLEYDKLVLATGATPVVPEIPGVDLKNVFTLHGVTDAEGIKGALDTGRAHDVVIIGGGLIGIEMTEALVQKGCRVTIVEQRSQILSMLDEDMALLVERHLEGHGVRTLTGTSVVGLEGENNAVKTVRTDKGILSADLVILATGIRPNSSLAQNAGLEIGVTGGVKVDDHLRSSDENIYAAGDCTETTHIVTGKPCYMPLGSTANKQGRSVAVNLCGGDDRFPGIIGTVACKVFECNIVRTGLNEVEAHRDGYKTVCVLAPGPDREHFVPQARTLMLKLVVDVRTRRLLGAQAIGPGHADKRLDVAALAINAGFNVDQIAQLDLCYAPQFAPVMDNLIMAANVARNKLDGYLHGVTPKQVHQRLQAGEALCLLDVRTPVELGYMRMPGATHIPLGALRERLHEVPKDKPIIAFCNYSLRGYEAALILRHAGYDNVAVMDGGLVMWPYEKIQ